MHVQMRSFILSCAVSIITAFSLSATYLQNADQMCPSGESLSVFVKNYKAR